MGRQERCNSFYAIDNIVTIRITMPSASWEDLRGADPAGGQCHFEYTGERYAWHHTTSVEVSGSRFPAGGSHTFSNVAIKKRSFCGSQSADKPCLGLDFSRDRPSNEDPIEDLIGTKHLALNNSKQDRSYIRQPLGYALFQKAGLAFSRCNFAHVFINGTALGFFINVEPIQKRYLEHCFNGNDSSNLYEIEQGEDFNTQTLDAGRLDFKGFSDYTDSADFRFAVQSLHDDKISEVVDLDQYLRYSAMQSLLKNLDSYNTGGNNTYVYNDAQPSAVPSAATVNFKFIPWGIDSILRTDHHYRRNKDSVLGRKVAANEGELARLKDQFADLGEGVFGRESHDSFITPLISQMVSILDAEGVTDSAPAIAGEIATVRRQARLARSVAFQLSEKLPRGDVSLLNSKTGRCLQVRSRPAGSGLRVVSGRSFGSTNGDRWFLRALGSHDKRAGCVIFNPHFRSYLHCSDTEHASNGHLLIVPRVAPSGQRDEGDHFAIEAVDTTDDGGVSGLFRLRSLLTQQYVRFGEKSSAVILQSTSDVYQVASPAQATVLYLF